MNTKLEMRRRTEYKTRLYHKAISEHKPLLIMEATTNNELTTTFLALVERTVATVI